MTLPPTVILTATRLEQAPLRQRLGDRYASHALQWCIGGMGAGATAAATQRILQEQAPRLIIQAGIAGSLRRDLTPATAHTAYIVRSDRQADLGAWRSESGTFEPFATLPEAQTIECPYAERLSSLLPQLPARSTNSACMPLPLRDDEALESMEGAAFFGVCQNSAIPYLQLRSISNRVGDPRTAWRIDEALKILTAGLEIVLRNFVP